LRDRDPELRDRDPERRDGDPERSAQIDIPYVDSSVPGAESAFGAGMSL
jgi:hypothetical protein